MSKKPSLNHLKKTSPNPNKHSITMAAKLITFFGLVALTQAGFIADPAWNAAPAQGWAAPATIIKKVVAAEAPANYQFNYDVNEASTGDVKSQHEKADNGVIKGSYQLNDADGFLRIVDYTADDVNGFQANVRREPLHQQQTIIKKIVQPATIIKKVIAAPSGPWY